MRKDKGLPGLETESVAGGADELVSTSNGAREDFSLNVVLEGILDLRQILHEQLDGHLQVYGVCGIFALGGVRWSRCLRSTIYPRLWAIA